MKTRISHLFVAFFAIGLLFSSCAKEAKDCSELAADVSTASAAYFSDQTESNCEAYKTALEAYANSTCQDGASFQTTADGLTCR